MMLMTVISSFIVIARDLPQSAASEMTEILLQTMVNDISKSIKSAGMDPFRGGKQVFNITTPIELNATIMDIDSYGLSNIVVNKAHFHFFSKNLQFDIEMPLVNITIGNTTLNAYVLQNYYTTESSLRVEIEKIRVNGHIDFDFDFHSGFTVSKLTIHFGIADVKPKVKLIIQGDDYSRIVNHFLSSIPEIINNYTDLIDESLEKFLTNYVKHRLSNL